MERDRNEYRGKEKVVVVGYGVEGGGKTQSMHSCRENGKEKEEHGLGGKHKREAGAIRKKKEDAEDE